MGGKDSGFASMAKARLRDVSSKGGKKAQKRHKFDPIAAKAAAAKGVQARFKRQAREAWDRLLGLGYEAEDLAKLHLTDAEIIYYGGRTAKAGRRVELQKRLQDIEG